MLSQSQLVMSSESVICPENYKITVRRILPYGLSAEKYISAPEARSMLETKLTAIITSVFLSHIDAMRQCRFARDKKLDSEFDVSLIPLARAHEPLLPEET
jgi:hypothetical protein